MLIRLRNTWQNNLRLRITVTLSVLLGLILLAGTALRLGEIRGSLEKTTQARAHAIGRTFTVLGSAALAENLYRVQEALADYRHDPDIMRVDVLDTDLMVIAATEPKRIGLTLNDRHLLTAQRLGEEIIEHESGDNGTPFLLAIEPLRDRGAIAGWVRIEFSLTEMHRELRHAVWESILIALLLIGASVLIVQMSMRRVSRLLHETSQRLQAALAAMQQQFPDQVGDIRMSSELPSAPPQFTGGEIEHIVTLINHSIRLVMAQGQSIRTFTSSLEEAIANRTAELNRTIGELKVETAERARTTEALRENEMKYRGLFESSRDAIMLLFPPEWKFTACNPATVALFGAESIEHFITLGPWDVSPDLQPDGEPSTSKAPQMIQQAMQEGSHFFEWTHRRINGSSFAATVLLTRMTLNGQTGLQATVRDVSEQTRAAQALRDLSAFQKALLDSAGHAIISTTPDGIIQTFNPAAESLLRYSADEVIGKQTLAIFHDPNEIIARAHAFSTELGIPFKPGFDVVVEKSRRSLPNTHEWTYIRKDGSRLTVLLTLTALRNPDQQVTGHLGVASDITPLKVAQQQLLVAKEAAESASTAKSQFLANMSHEIRTPMNGVLGMTELLLATTLSDKQRQMAGTVQRSAESLLTIINDILDFSKIEAGKLQLECTTFRLSDVLDDICRLLAETVCQKGVALLTDISQEIPVTLQGDPTRLRQILLNLVGNAVKFTPAGSIRVGIGCIEHTETHVSLKINVRDTGIGIPHDVQGQIFDAFAQADGSTTRKFGGTGLGLAIVKQLAQLMGGTVGVESTPGVGSTFWFTVKLTIPSETVIPSVSDLPQPTFSILNATILLAEDNPVNQAIAMAMLETLGCTVDVANDGQEAVAATLGKTYDLALMDCQMPNIDGLEAVRRIRKHERLNASGHHLPIVALTADATENDRRRCLAAGMDGYLSKPFTRTQLYQALIPWLSQKAA